MDHTWFAQPSAEWFKADKAVVGVFNIKGGVGKSTLTASLGWAQTTPCV